MEKTYIVTLAKKDDLEGFYSDMESNGFRIAFKRPLSRNTHYYMTKEQAETLRNDPRVISVELPLEERGIVARPCNYSSYTLSGNFTKSGSNLSAATALRQWGHLHVAGDETQRRKGTWGTGSTLNVSDSVSVFNDATNVDVVICDDPVATDPEEYYSLTTASTRFIEYDWYTQLNTYVSSLDTDGETLPTPPYANYFTNNNNTESHGTHVAGTAVGAYYGWARNANLYSFQVLNNTSGTGTAAPSELQFDYLRAFHRYKPVNSTTGKRNPTITNHSWSYSYDLEQIFGYTTSVPLADIDNIVFNGVTYSSSNPGPSGWTLNGIETDFGFRSDYLKVPARVASIDADIEDAIDDGVVIIAAAANDNYYIERDTTGASYNSSVSIDNGAGTAFTIPIHRGPTPGATKGVICVGAINTDTDFRRAPYTNYGPRIDVFAPGTLIHSAYNSDGTVDEKYEDLANATYNNYFYSISGTSMASPQVCGVIACVASGNDRFTQGDAITFIQKFSRTGDMTFDSGDGSFADPTAQKNSPNRELKCTAPRSTGQSDPSVVGRRESDITDTGNRQVYPRTKTLYS